MGMAAGAGLTAKVTAFVNGAANMLGALKIPLKYGQAIIGVLIASFACTTLDTATCIQRYIVTELAIDYNIKPLQGRHPATAFAVLAAAILAFAQGGGKGALMLWPLFGACNQLLAGLALLVASVYLIKQGTKAWVTAVPMFFMIIFSSWAMIINLSRFISQGQWHLTITGMLMLILEAWMIIEAVICVRKIRIVEVK